MTSFIHQHSLMVYAAVGFAGYALFLMYTQSWFGSAVAVAAALVCIGIKFLICGWVHTFVAFAMVDDSGRYQVVREKEDQ